MSAGGRARTALLLALAACAPGVIMRLAAVHTSHPVEALLFGLAIVGAAFILSWGAEAAQLDISAGLAIAVLAFIAVLPEYAVDLIFAGKAGNAYSKYGSTCLKPGSPDASPCSLALANMTGSNRLLIGIGWSLVVFAAWYALRRRRMPGGSQIVLERSHSVELSYLTVAVAYSLTLPLKRTITLLDAALLVAIFVAYTIRVAGSPAEEPDLVGPAKWIGSFDRRRRRTAVAGLLVLAAAVILLCAERFAEALVGTGRVFGISEFLLVQWLAPLASEAPELLIAGMFAWRLKTSAGLSTLVSAKVNQWTLLIGTLPVVFAITSGTLHGLPIDAGQREELLLTAAQSVFAVAILSSLSISVKEAWALFSLFWAQFLIGALVPGHAHGVERVIVSGMYLVLGAMILLRDRRRLPKLLRDGFRTPHEHLHT
ncbi:MAG: sodium/calcium exchanger rane region [Acidimicrobiales bacterium]|jgi:cation:H+ antiporter|nr:sodium/calcium exchanger rane region [Acidimicrobiales bacterium]